MVVIAGVLQMVATCICDLGPCLQLHLLLVGVELGESWVVQVLLAADMFCLGHVAPGRRAH